MSRQVDFDIRAEDLIHLTRQEVWKWRDPSIRGYLRFEDGVLYTRGSIAITCYYIWQIARHYPKGFKFVRRYVEPIIKGFRTSTPGDVAAEIVNDAHDLYGCEEWWDRENEDRRVYEMVNSVYNMIDIELDEYTLSLNAFDYLEVFEHPDIQKWKSRIDNEVNLTSTTIAEYSDNIINEVLTNKDFDNNSLATYARGNLIKLGQLANSIAAIGYTTEIDSSIFPNPIRKCYFEGMSELWELMQESRSASLASMYQQIVMPDSEYFNRTLQLVCGTLQHLYKGVDCGSKEYLYTTIKDKSMLKAMTGIWMAMEGTEGDLMEIKATDYHLVGKTIRHRSPLTCHHPDRNGICGRCFGVLERAVPEGTNIGHTSAVEFCGPLSQLVLSLKHYISNATASSIELSGTDRQFVRIVDEESMLYLNQNLNTDEWEVVFLSEDVSNIHDVEWVEHTDLLNPARIGRIKALNFRKRDDPNYSYTLYIGSDGHPAAFTSEFLKFAKEYKWVYDVHGNYVFDLSMFNPKEPLLEVPQIKFSPPEFISNCQSFLLSKDTSGKNKQKGKRLGGYGSLDAAVSGFYDLIDGYLNTHYSHLQVIVLAMCVESLDNRDYRLPSNRHNGQPATLTDIQRYRSLAMTMAYEAQKRILMTPSSYTVRQRPPHPYDPILTGE